MASALRYAAPIALFSTGRLEELVSFEHWVQAMSTGNRRDLGALWAYELYPADRAREAMDIRLGDVVMLEAYAFSDEVLLPGDMLTTKLFWRCDDHVGEDYTSSCIWSMSGGRCKSSTIGYHCWGRIPVANGPRTSWCQTRTPLRSVLLPAPGDYKVVVGMYHWLSLERLLAYRDSGQRWQDDLIPLTEIDVVAS